jgi:PAS domain S-box-containing protein
MVWVSVAVLNGIIAIAYFCIAYVILRGLQITEQMWSNRLATATAFIFVTCAVHHGAHTFHLFGPSFGFEVDHGLAMRDAFDWHMAAWDLVGATVATYYLTLRRSYAKLLDAPVLFSATPLDTPERRLELLSAAADDRALVLVDPDGAVRDWPASAEAVTGTAARVAVGRPLTTVLGPFGDVVPDPDADHEVELHVPLDGGERWLDAITRPVHDDDGQFVGWGLVLRDVTARHRSATELRTAHLMLESVLDAATGVAVISTDLDGTITVFNAGAERMLGYRAQDVVGRADPAMLHDPDELAAAAASRGVQPGFEVLVAGVRDGGSETRDWTYVRSDAARLTVSLTVTPTRGPDGAIAGFLGIATDVTARRRDERLLLAHVEVAYALASSAPAETALYEALAALGGGGGWDVAQLWVAGDDGLLRRRSSWTSTAESTFVTESADLEFRAGEGFPGRAFSDGAPIWTADLAEDARAPRAPLARANGLHALVAVPVGSEDGIVGALEIVSSDRREAGPEEIAALQVTGRLLALYLERQHAHDEVIAAEAELRRKAVELERSNADLELFASVASHDLQEPLRKIQTFGEKLNSKYATELDEQGQQYVVRMQAAATRMRSLIEDLLSYSRVTSRARAFSPVDLGVIADEVLDDLESSVLEAGAEVHVGALPVISADPTQMRQLLQNLIGNALKFHREDVPSRIDVTAVQDNGHVELTVADNGIGFDAEYAERIFGIFERLHGRHEFAGTGIGLAVCRKIAQRHGGDILATGKPGEGARFTVALPSTPTPEEA